MPVHRKRNPNSYCERERISKYRILARKVQKKYSKSLVKR